MGLIMRADRHSLVNTSKEFMTWCEENPNKTLFMSSKCYKLRFQSDAKKVIGVSYNGYIVFDYVDELTRDRQTWPTVSFPLSRIYFSETDMEYDVVYSKLTK